MPSEVIWCGDNVRQRQWSVQNSAKPPTLHGQWLPQPHLGRSHGESYLLQRRWCEFSQSLRRVLWQPLSVRRGRQ